MSKPEPKPAAEQEYAQRWWNVLGGDQRVRALHGTGATEEQAEQRGKDYGALDADTKGKVNELAQELYGEGHGSAGAWWRKLTCKQKRIAVGEGNTGRSGELLLRNLSSGELTPGGTLRWRRRILANGGLGR